MYILAFLALVTAFLCSLAGAGAAAAQLWQNQRQALGLVEKASVLSTGLMGISSVILLAALTVNDFSLEYVTHYSDRFLPLFYRLTAFWAGQEGSLLFWALGTGLFGVIFFVSHAYNQLGEETKLWFWMFFLTVQGVFLLLVTGWSNPFITFNQPLPDGQGLNPLLQNPGMIFHPPLLFLGYAGFTVPGCLALAQTHSGGRRKRDAVKRQSQSEHILEEDPWFDLCRPFTLTAWILLSAGIILGAWWAYMELGWGGYWAWDPVENASLIPWLIATAFLHTSVLEARQGHLSRSNVCLIGLTIVSAFLATYIVRSGVVQSLHAFPDGGVGRPLLLFILAGVLVVALSTISMPRPDRPFDPGIKGFLLCLVAMILMSLALIILLATLWPVISKGLALILPDRAVLAQGLNAEAYNRACLPLFTLLALILIFCPWMRQHKQRALYILFFLAAILLCGSGILRYLASSADFQAEGFHAFVPPLAAAAAVTAIISVILLVWRQKGILRLPATVATHAVHLGLALMVLGVAFSGPYKTETTHTLPLGQSVQLGGYRFTLENVYTGEGPGYSFYEAAITVSRNGRALDQLNPQFRQYAKYPRQSFLESATRFSLSTEIYVALLGVNEAGRSADLRVSLHPLVNWIWIGGVLLSFAPLLGLFGKRTGKAAENA